MSWLGQLRQKPWDENGLGTFCPWDENDLGTVKTPTGQGDWRMGSRLLQGWVREVNEARSSRSCISEDRDFKSYSQYGKGHWRVLSKLF